MPVVTLAIAPSGQVVFLPDGGDGPALPDKIAARIAEAFHEGTAAGLLHLAAAELTTPLPPAFVFWRDFSRRCLTQLCRIAGVESEAPDTAAPPPSREELRRIVETSPPLRGLEYLSPAVLENLWTALEGRTRDEAGRAGGNIQDYLKKRNPLWNMVGRVAFHLAENRKNEARPFGFLVTYTTRLSGLAKPQFLPLGKAFRLRGVDHRELIAAPGAADLAASSGMREKMIAEEDLAGIFGIEIDGGSAALRQAPATPEQFKTARIRTGRPLEDTRSPDKGAETDGREVRLPLFRAPVCVCAAPP